MDKIYTRSRIKISKKCKIILIIAIIVIIIIFALNKVTYPLFSKKCIYKAKVLVTEISNEETQKIMENYTYKDLIHIEQDENGNVTFLESNVIEINKIKAEIINKVQERFLNTSDTTIKVKLGAFTGNRLLSTIGPEIEIEVIPSGIITGFLETEFYSVGVNQSIHRIYLNLNCTVSVLSPFESISQNIESKILLSESIIVGNTPDTYYNIKGIKDFTAEEQSNFIN